MVEYQKYIIQKDDLETLLNNAPNVTDVEWINLTNCGYSRLIQFVVKGIIYRIEWWTNVSYLQTQEGLVIPFESIKISGTWPNRYKTNLQFYAKGEVAAILPLEEYEVE